MIKNYALCNEVLKRFRDSGILENIIVIGSWCIYFYKDYFREIDYNSLIRTRDIDFLVPIPKRWKTKVVNALRIAEEERFNDFLK